MAKAVLAIVVWFCLGASVALAQSNKQNPAWGQLTAQQQSTLAPIQGEWDQLEPIRKRKWLGIAQRYPKMKAEEQQRVQRRMKEWASLTPEQRRAAREKYREFELLPQEERQAMREKWEQYQQELAERERAEKERVAQEEAARAADAQSPVQSTGAEGGSAPPEPAAGLTQQ